VTSPTIDLSKELEFELQESDHNRELDSLETVVVRSFLSARGLTVGDDYLPDTNTIRGWLTWAAHYSPAG
jgi:hypothetical protein